MQSAHRNGRLALAQGPQTSCAGGRWRSAVAAVAGLGLVIGLSACGKSAAPVAGPAVGVATGGTVTAPEAVAPSAAAPAGQNQLAKAYHAIRCGLVGARAVDPALYTAHGFASVAAFNDAFRVAAQADPTWAEGVVHRSHARGCKAELTDAPAGTATPSAAGGAAQPAAGAGTSPQGGNNP